MSIVVYDHLNVRLDEAPKLDERLVDVSCHGAGPSREVEQRTTADKGLEVAIVRWKLLEDVVSLRSFAAGPLDDRGSWSAPCIG